MATRFLRNNINASNLSYMINKTSWVVLIFSAIAFASPAESKRISREGIEWCDIWISHANETNLPRVLLIGDSITRGYYLAVEKRLGGKAYVARLTTSAFLSDPMFTQQIAMVLDNIKFDVIQFNNGMHGWQHSEAEYRKAFPNFIETIQKHAPNAKLIWASTTPLRPSTNSPPTTLKSASSERIITRNAIALEFVRAKRIVVNDLYTPALGRGELYTDGVHFNKEGIATQADLVTSQVEKLLSR
jgi:lysophospholipase L1-like esterase